MENTATQIDLRAHAQQAISYPAYRRLIDAALERNQTTGNNHSPDMLSYTRMNVQRMNRLDKQVQIAPDLAEMVQSIQKPLLWLVLTEAWCGDAAQNLPVLQHLAMQQPQIELGLLLRDEHLPLMDAFLTNGGRSIPKLIIVNPENGDLLGSWGPRPQAAQVLYMDLKAQGLPYLEASTALHKWYAQDKTVSMQAELLALLQGMNW